jgi:hypothetical protein
MDAIRGSNRFGPSGTADALVDDPRTEGELWADVQALDLVPFPVDPPGGWQHGHDGFDDGFDGGFDPGLDAIDFGTGALQLADGVDIAAVGAAFEDDRGISTADFSDGIDSLDAGTESMLVGPTGWGLEFLSLDGEDPPPITALDAAGDLTWADLAPAFDVVDAVDLELDAPLESGDFGHLEDVVVFDAADRGDDFVGAPLPMFVLDRLTSVELDQVESMSPLSQDTVPPLFVSEDDAFGDQYETEIVE